MLTILANWQFLVAAVVIISAAGIWAYNFFKLSPEEREEEIRTILVNLTYEAEKALGAKTGSLKRSQVYNLFKKNCPFLATITSMAMFDKLLDESLDIMKRALEVKEK